MTSGGASPAGAAAAAAAVLAGDTIAALATPAGRSAIAVIRISGPAAAAIGARLLAPWPILPRVATLCTIRDAAAPDQDPPPLLDRGLATWFPSPASYTGEDVLELSVHGGALVPALVLGAAHRAGARPALAGEFTRRAVLSGKMDLVRAEAIGDLIDARSAAAHRAAVAQAEGGLTREVAGLRDALLDLEALCAYDIDFPEEDDGPVAPARILTAADAVLERLDRLLATAPAGQLVRSGAIVVIAGRPNAGKSSLFNALLGESRALVSEAPGTTRDAIEVGAELGGWPVRLVDTAGLRESGDAVERMGVEVAHRWLTGAHLVVLCADADDRLEADVAALRARAPVPCLPVRTKVDLVPAGYQIPGDAVAVSVVTRAGLRPLADRIGAALDARYGAIEPDVPLLTRERHRLALARARAETAAFREGWAPGARGALGALPAPVAAVHLRSAAGALEELIGAVDVEDVLDRLFSTFCVGK